MGLAEGEGDEAKIKAADSVEHKVDGKETTAFVAREEALRYGG